MKTFLLTACDPITVENDYQATLMHLSQDCRIVVVRGVQSHNLEVKLPDDRVETWQVDTYYAHLTIMPK
jgi:hypothetical protein